MDGVKVLVVDDQPRNLFAITALLERGSADVTVVETGAEAARGAGATHRTSTSS